MCDLLICRGGVSGSRRPRDYLSSLSRADMSIGSQQSATGAPATPDQTSLSVANSSALTLSSEDLSKDPQQPGPAARSMSPRFNSTLVHENGNGHQQ